MKQINSGQLSKFESRIRKIVKELSQHNELVIHQAVSQSYYMQKAEELKLLKEQLSEARARLEEIQNLVCSHYSELYLNWRNDVRWLHNHLQKKTVSQSN